MNYRLDYNNFETAIFMEYKIEKTNYPLHCTPYKNEDLLRIYV